MIAPLLFALVGQAKMGPAFPPMSSADFQNAVRSVEENLEKHDFEAAQKGVALLPKREFSITVDDHKVPAEERFAFHQAVVEAMGNWSAAKITLKPTGGDVHIGFDSGLADDPETGAASNVVTFYGTSAGQPRLSAFIGLKRGKAGRDATAGDVINDTRYVIGTYLGLARHKLPALSMYGAAEADTKRVIGKPEIRCSYRTLELVDQLRKAVAAKTSVGLSGEPAVGLDTSSFDGKATQGEVVDLPIQVTNKGTGVVTLDAEGDCGCIVPESAPSVEPGKSGSIGMRLETTEYVGAIERNVVVYTNDPNLPATIIPVHVSIAPRYRFLTPEGSTLSVDDAGRTTDLYLVFPDGGDMNMTHLRTVGVEGATATYTLWKGKLPDPELHEPEADRHGYKIHLTIPGKLPTPRTLLSLAAVTTTEGFTVLYKDLYAQKGIVAFPSELFMGELSKQAKTATLVINRPGKPFQVRSVKTSTSFLAASVEPGAGPDEFKVVVKYDGRGPSGDLGAKLTIVTDDPKQPTLTVPITGSVR